MNIAMWVLAGGVLGWVACAILKVNKGSGLIVSIIIGAVGGFAGGNVIAPILGAVVETPNDFSLFAMTIALASAAGCLAISDLLFNRFRV
jgi:uncharacterized membrane protein YeaQ/YmgE (transglycosylase-associated protein family)